MQDFIDELIQKIEQEKRDLGKIIDDRSLNNIPLSAYVQKYNKLDRILRVCQEESGK